jgi:conjugation system TraG family ATPase
MLAKWSEWMPVYGFEGECILSKQGDYTVAYRVSKPELFTLSGADYKNLHQTMVRAIRVLPPNTILHLQDWYTQISYQPDTHGADTTWLGQSSERFFNERPWLDHEAFLFITKRTQRSWSSSAITQLIRPALVPHETLDEQTIQTFLGQCGQFARILTDSGLIHVERLNQLEIWSSKQKLGLIEQYCSLEKGPNPILKDVAFNDGIRIGNLYTCLYTLADPEALPAACSPYTDYEPFSTEPTPYPTGFVSTLGPLLPFNHIVNQYMFIGDETAALKKLDSHRRRLQSLSPYSRNNAVASDALNTFLTEAAKGRQHVKAHFNVFVWTHRNTDLPEINNRVSSALTRLGATPRLETIGAPQIWWAGIPGNAGDFPMNETFDTFSEIAACFFQYESNSRTSISPFGIRLGDRLTGHPLHVDIDHEPRAKGQIGNFNTVCISGSGGGKSFWINHLVRSYYEQGGHVLIIDVGHSYELQCQLHNGVYFTFEEQHPIAFNPFQLGAGESFDTEKKESLKSLLLALWKKTDESQRRSEYVALSTALQLYFDHLRQQPSIPPCFNSFYEFLQNNFSSQTQHIKEKDFDLSNFLFVLSPYYKGGEFDYLLNASQNLDLLQQRFVVFELDAIKNHPILYPVVTLVIMEIAISKMRKLKHVFKAIIIEEAWQPIAEQGMGGFMRFLEKTARKFFTKFLISTQEIEDLISSEVLRNTIVNNSDTVILLDQSKLANNFDQLQQLLSITEKQKAEILSLNKGKEPGRQYKDVWIRTGPTHSKVYRLEVSDEEYCIYTSEQKEKHIIKDYIQRFGSVKSGIRALINEARDKGGKLFIFALLLITPSLLHAQDIPFIGTIVSKVVKALDLQVQRIQTQTIWLEEAQKTVENAMSQLDLSDIRDWVQAQKDLYDQYFRELWQVKSVITTYHRITELVQRQEQIVAACKQASHLFSTDKHLTPDELAHIEAVYAGILKESLNNLNQLALVANSFTTQMSDEARLSIINKTAANMDRNYLDLTRFNNQNALLSSQRSNDENNIQILRKLYGL